MPLEESPRWIEDPQGNHVAAPGMMERRWMHRCDDPTVRAIVKRGADQLERYAIGMERVSYLLGSLLGLPIPETTLQRVDGHPSSVQLLVPDSRTHLSAGGAPMLTSVIENESQFPLALMFDIWTGNTDRRDTNLLYEALPEGTPVARATRSRFWLIDHGACGLWPPAKFAARGAATFPTRAQAESGQLHERGERHIALAMPSDLRMRMKQNLGESRAQLVEQVQAIGDSAIESAITGVHPEFIGADAAELTGAFLQARRDCLCRVLETYW